MKTILHANIYTHAICVNIKRFTDILGYIFEIYTKDRRLYSRKPPKIRIFLVCIRSKELSVKNSRSVF